MKKGKWRTIASNHVPRPSTCHKQEGIGIWNSIFHHFHIHIHLCLLTNNNLLTPEGIKYHLDIQLQTSLTIFIQKLIPRPPVWRTTTFSTPITNPQKAATDCCHCINLIPIVLGVFNSWLGLMGWLLGYLQCHSDKVAWLLHSKRTPLSSTIHLPFEWLNRRVNNSNHKSRRRQEIITPFVSIKKLPFSRCKIFPALVKMTSGKTDTWRAETKSTSTTASMATHCLK